MSRGRSTAEIAAELNAKKAQSRAVWFGAVVPVVSVPLASFAPSMAPQLDDASKGVLAFLLIAACAFGPALLVRAVAPRGVLVSLVIGQAATLGILSLAAFGLGAEEMRETLLLISGLWIVSIGSSVAGHALGAVIAARRAETSDGGAEPAAVSDVERRAIAELGYLTIGFELGQITRTHEASPEGALQIELESRILESRGYRRGRTDRTGGASGAEAAVNFAIGSDSDPVTVRVTYERIASDESSPGKPVADRRSEWEKHGSPRDST